MLKGGALFRYRTPTDELYVEQIIISGAVVAASANRRGNCFKIEKGGEKIVFQAEDEVRLMRCFSRAFASLKFRVCSGTRRAG